MTPERHYAHALDGALRSAERELAHLRATRRELLVGSPEAIEAAGQEAARRSGRLTRRIAVLEQRARDLARAIGADGPGFRQLAPRLAPEVRERLAARIAALSAAGADVQRERRRFREALVIGRAVVRELLDGLTQGAVSHAPLRQRTSRGIRRPVTCGALNREA